MDDSLPYFATYDYVSVLCWATTFGMNANEPRGMQTVWVMGNETEVLGKVPRPEVEGYLAYGGDVYGNESHWPTVVDYNDAWADNQ